MSGGTSPPVARLAFDETAICVSERQEAWSWLAQRLAPHWRLIAGYSAGLTLLSAFNLPILLILQRLFDRAIPDGNIARIAVLAGLFLAIRLISAGGSSLLAWLLLPKVRKINAGLRSELFVELSSWRWPDITALDLGMAEARMVHETEHIETLLHHLIVSALPSVIPLLIFVSAMIVIAPQLAAAVIVLALMTRLVSWPVVRRSRRAMILFRSAFERYHITLRHELSLMPVFRAMALEKDSARRATAAAGHLGSAGGDMAVSANHQSNFEGAGNALVAALTFVLGGTAVALGQLTLGGFVTFIFAASQASGAGAAMVRLIPAAMAGDEALMRLGELRRKGSPQSAGGTQTPDLSQSIVLEKVELRYADRIIFSDVNLEIKPGAVTAISGPSGRGKTSLLNLVLGLTEPDTGKIRIGKFDYSQLDLSHLRREIGYLPQQPSLFAGSIAENIRFGRQGLDAAAIAQAILRSMMSPVLNGAPQGEDTLLADNGHRLSGGEKQRLALARALASGPRMLVLDEPTNHLDDDTARTLIDRVFTKRPPGETILVATHDPRILAMADVVWEIDNQRAFVVAMPG
jgi:ATP-binding cassette, subfamily B, bacterial